MFSQFSHGPQGPNHTSSSFEEIAGYWAAVVFFGAAILLIAGAMPRNSAEAREPNYVAEESLPAACRALTDSLLFEPLPPHIAELCASYH